MKCLGNLFTKFNNSLRHYGFWWVFKKIHWISLLKKRFNSSLLTSVCLHTTMHIPAPSYIQHIQRNNHIQYISISSVLIHQWGPKVWDHQFITYLAVASMCFVCIIEERRKWKKWFEFFLQETIATMGFTGCFESLSDNDRNIVFKFLDSRGWPGIWEKPEGAGIDHSVGSWRLLFLSVIYRELGFKTVLSASKSFALAFMPSVLRYASIHFL